MKLHSLRYLIREGLKNILSNRMMSLASVVVLVSCLIITGSAALISVNVNALIANIGDDNQLTVYLKPDFPDADSVKLRAKLSAIENITNCRYRTKDDVLKDYQETLGKDLYETMQGSGNPFGNEYRVTLKDLSLYDQTVKQIETLDGIDKISDRSDIAGKLTRLNYFVTVAGLWFVVILAVVTLFIISNTIKMTMYSRRFEIGIMKSVGATNAFIRIPFLIEAMGLGLISGLVSSAVVILLYEPVRNGASGVIHLIGKATLPTEQIWFPTLLAMSASGLLIGLVGGFISVSRYLNKEGGAIFGT